MGLGISVVSNPLSSCHMLPFSPEKKGLERENRHHLYQNWLYYIA